MRLLITGAAGMLGLDVVASAERVGHEVVARSRAELDITDAAAVRATVAECEPAAVINCAAFTNVDGAEAEPEQALAVNGDGAGHVAAAAAEAGAWTVHVSTDYVFDGHSELPYVESAPVGPRSQYGSSKLAGERAVARAAAGRHTIVRTAWLFGVGGPCFPATILRLADEREELSVVDDQIGCPTFTGHLAPALVSLAADRETIGLAHVAGGGRCSWFEFATEIVRVGDADCRVLPTDSESMARPAPRPAWSVLVTERGAGIPRLAHWQEGLEEFMARRSEST